MWNVLKHYWPVVRQYKLHVSIMLVGIIIAVGSEMAIPFFIREFANLIAFPFSAAAENFAALEKVLGLMVITYFIYWLFWRICDFVISDFEPKVMRDLEEMAFARILQHSFRFFQESFTGSLVKKVSRFRDAFETIFDTLYLNFG